jgi:Helix-turn-helix domain
MLSRKPPAPPWGALLTTRRRHAGLSVREAADQAAMSESRWRQLTAGHRRVGGQYIPDAGPDRTIARMAAVVGATPDELAAAGRPGAADRLTRTRRDAPDDTIRARIAALDPDTAKALLIQIYRALAETVPDDGPLLRYASGT